MRRTLAAAIFTYAAISVAIWVTSARLIYLPRDGFGICGNAISDPFALLVNIVGPMAAACAVLLVGRCIRIRRWPRIGVAALATFVVTSACLAYEGLVLFPLYGLEIGRVWWLPWR
jgi:hypothetical protein